MSYKQKSNELDLEKNLIPLLLMGMPNIALKDNLNIKKLCDFMLK